MDIEEAIAKAVEIAEQFRGPDYKVKITDEALTNVVLNVFPDMSEAELRRALMDRGLIERRRLGPRPMPNIPDDLFAPIVGFQDIKDVLLWTLRSPRPVHQLLHGPPASAKTLFMLELERLGDARYTLGSSTSRAGLRQLLLERQPRILLIDELDKGRDSDYSVLLSAMEGGRVVDTHFNRYEDETWDLRVFAAANVKDRIWPELLSRFGEGLRIQPYTPDEFLVVAERVLAMREGAPPEAAKLIATAVLQQLRSRDVRDAIRVYRLAQSIEDVPRVVDILRARR